MCTGKEEDPSRTAMDTRHAQPRLNRIEDHCNFEAAQQPLCERARARVRSGVALRKGPEAAAWMMTMMMMTAAAMAAAEESLAES